MKYIVDQNILNVAKELTKRGFETVTATVLTLGHQDSSKRASDFRIMEFLKTHRGDHVLLTADTGLAADCREEGLPCVLLTNPPPPLDEILRLLDAGFGVA